jgi:hypothetical protein
MKGLRGILPVRPDELHIAIGPTLLEQPLPESILSLQGLADLVTSIVTHLKRKFTACRTS